MTEASKMNWIGLVIGLLIGLAAPYLNAIPDWLVWIGIGSAGLITCLLLGRAASLYCAVGAASGWVVAVLLKVVLPALIHNRWISSNLCGAMIGQMALIALAVLAGTAVGIGLQALGKALSQKS